MPQRDFRIQYLLAILLPVLFTYFAVQLFYAETKPQSPVETSTEVPALDAKYGNTVPIAINELPDEQKSASTDHIWISIALALLMGIAALLGHYLKSGLVWVAMLVLTLVLSVLGAGKQGMGLTLFFLPNLALSVLLALITRHIFFNVSLIRFRMLLTSFAGAIALTLYYRALYLLKGIPFAADNWQGIAVNSLIIFIFITFGLTLADLAVVQLELRRERSAGTITQSDDEDEDAD